MQNPNTRWARPRDRYKRPFDLAVLALVATVLAPFWALTVPLIALAIRLEDGGRILHLQRRVGRCGKEFEVVKFRTMVDDAERLTGPVLAVPADSRITRVGKLLRRYHIDELPQVINIVRGEMSLVGPRPERPDMVRRIMRRTPDFWRRLSVAPGIAGLAQARTHYRARARVKLRYDRMYIANMGPWLDIKLLIACVWKVLRAPTHHDVGNEPPVANSPK